PIFYHQKSLISSAYYSNSCTACIICPCAASTVLPVFNTSASTSSLNLLRIPVAILFNSLARFASVCRGHLPLSKAVLAASTAASASSFVPLAAVVRISPVAGVTTSILYPLLLSLYLTLIKHL